MQPLHSSENQLLADPISRATTGRSSFLTDRLCWPACLYGLIALVGCAFAFVGLSTSSFWADELFTMFVLGDRSGVAEMMQRILGDVHPPLYYLLLHGWTSLAGTSELTTRSLSAVCAVFALAVFAWSVRRTVRPAAIGFGCAVAATSMFWFEQAQNARSYAWVMLLSAGLLAFALQLRRRVLSGPKFPLGAWLGLSVVGAAGSQSHSYLLLGVGVALLYLIVTLPDRRIRMALTASGALILGLYLVFLWFQLHAVVHDFNATWYRSDFGFFGAHIMRALRRAISRQAMLVCCVLLVAWFVQRWRKNDDDASPTDIRRSDAAWATGLCVVVVLGVIASGIVVSRLIAPSFSDRNVLTIAPFVWLLLARLYDVAGPRAGTRGHAALVMLIALLIGSQQLLLARGRFLPRNEPWRASSSYVRDVGTCATAPAAVTLPDTYGNLGPGVRGLVERHYFGYYLPADSHVQLLSPTELLMRYRAPDAAVSAACPLVAWNVHGMGAARALTLALALANQPGIEGHRIVLQEFSSYSLSGISWKSNPDAYVFLLGDSTAVSMPPADRVVVTRIDEHARSADTAVFSIQHWHAGRALDPQRIVVPTRMLAADPLLPLDSASSISPSTADATGAM